jgi:hypothetical protein
MENTTTDTAAFPDAVQDESLIFDEPHAPPEGADVYEELLEHTLSDEEKEDRRKTLESVDREIIRLEEEKKAANQVVNAQIKTHKAQRESILEVLDSGVEKRPTPCYEQEVTDGAGNVLRIEVRRVDNGAVVEERSPTMAEVEGAAKRRQGNLFGDDARDTDAPPPDLYDPGDPVASDDDLEPTPEALAQAAVDEERVVRTTSAEARKRKARKQTDAPSEEPAE